MSLKLICGQYRAHVVERCGPCGSTCSAYHVEDKEA